MEDGPISFYLLSLPRLYIHLWEQGWGRGLLGNACEGVFTESQGPAPKGRPLQAGEESNPVPVEPSGKLAVQGYLATPCHPPAVELGQSRQLTSYVRSSSYPGKAGFSDKGLGFEHCC